MYDYNTFDIMLKQSGIFGVYLLYIAVNFVAVIGVDIERSVLIVYNICIRHTMMCMHVHLAVIRSVTLESTDGGVNVSLCCHLVITRDTICYEIFDYHREQLNHL